MKLYQKDRDVTTTVGELVKELLKVDQNALVFTEGCDCIGNVVSVEVDRDGSVLINRDDYMFEGYGEDRKIVAKYAGRVEEREDV